MGTPTGLGKVVAPVLTPFGVGGQPDAARFTAHARWLLDEGATGLAPFGTTSEANSLSLDERKLLLTSLIAAGIEPSRLMPGTGMSSLPEAIDLTRHAVGLGAGGVLMLPPFYYKAVKDDGLFRFFAEVIEKVGDKRLKVYLYHIPPVAQVGFSAELIERLIKAYPQTVVGLKDSSGDWAHTKMLIERFPGFQVYSGSEIALRQNLEAKGAGTISASVNVNARMMRSLVDAIGTSQAEALEQKVTGVRKALQAHAMIPVLKAIVAHLRKDPVWAQTRPPLMAMPEAEAQAAVPGLVAEMGLKPLAS
ncbi:MAG: dihydrodipicolinate synthase family protein [Hyphomicrobiaceae bacterium]|mgnify:CR=1 FL=1